MYKYTLLKRISQGGYFWWSLFTHVSYYIIMKSYSLVGNTPLIKINYLFEGKERHVYAKLESYNVTGSIKDRLVYYVLDKAKLREGQTIVEATSGNTGIALASYGARYGHPVVIFMPDFVSKERQELLKAYGAKVHLVSRESGGFKECVSKAKRYATLNDAYLFNQFSNYDNVKCHYDSTGLEIVNSLNYVDKFVSGVGTGGTLIGVGSRLKDVFGSKIVAIEPKNLPILKNKNAVGEHKIDGIGDDFIPDIVELDIIDDVIDIDDADAISMAVKLSRELGLGVGISSGANFIGAVLSNKGDDEVVTVFADDNKKYLSVFKEENNVNENLISNKVKLVSFEVI